MKDKQTDELIPCPFCGGKAEYDWQEAGMCSPNQPDLVDIYCLDSDCGALIRTSGKEPNEAIKAWNMRDESSIKARLRDEVFNAVNSCRKNWDNDCYLKDHETAIINGIERKLKKVFDDE